MGMNRCITFDTGSRTPVEVSPEIISECRARVKQGAAFLDRKVPGWRRVLRRHEDTFDICQSDCCVLGTLAAHPPKALRAQLKAPYSARLSWDYCDMLVALDLATDTSTPSLLRSEKRTTSLGFLTEDSLEHFLMDILWRAEFTR